jgi:hypothetical protein
MFARRSFMRVHPNQVNPNPQLDAMYAAQKAAAKREAARTRKKLSDFASALAGEADNDAAFTVSLEDRDEESRDQRSSQQRREAEPAADNTISDWA